MGIFGSDITKQFSGSGNLFGQEDAERAIATGEARTRAARQRLKKRRRRILRETEPFREAGMELLELFSGAPGESEFFKRGLETGSTQLSQQLARFGLSDSGTAGIAFGELGSGLLAQEEALRQQGLLSAAQLGTTGFGLTSNLAAQEAGLAGQLSQLALARGQAQVAGRNALIGTGLQIGGLALLGGLSGGAAPVAGGLGLLSGISNPFAPPGVLSNTGQNAAVSF